MMYLYTTNLILIGLGCSRKDAEKWIAHQEDFNALLENLNQGADSEEADPVPDSDSKPFVQSLEAKSKSSRSRVQ